MDVFSQWIVEFLQEEADNTRAALIGEERGQLG